MLHQDKPLKFAGAVLDVLGLALLQCSFSWITITMENGDAGVYHPYPGFQQASLLPISSCDAKIEKDLRKVQE